jgi:membrane dipeptidase
VRNVPDDVLRRLTANGGIVMVTHVPGFVSEPLRQWGERRGALQDSLEARQADETEADAANEAFLRTDPRPVATIADVANHIEHVRDIAGIDHVGIGGDYDGISSTPVGLDDVSTYPLLIAELLRRGWTEDAVGKLTNGNVLRVLRQAEEVARALQAEGPADTARLP